MAPSGGIQTYQWDSIPVKLIGSGIVNNKAYQKIIQGGIMGCSAHLDQRDGSTTMADAFSLVGIARLGLANSVSGLHKKTG